MKKILSLLPLLFAVLFAACGGSSERGPFEKADLSKLSAEDLKSIELDGYEADYAVCTENIEGRDAGEIAAFSLAIIETTLKDAAKDGNLHLTLEELQKANGANVIVHEFEGTDGETYGIYIVFGANGTLLSYMINQKMMDAMVSEMDKNDGWDDDFKAKNPSKIEKAFSFLAAMVASDDYKPELLITHIVTYDGKKALLFGGYQSK